MFSLKIAEKPVVLLCCHWKTIGFITKPVPTTDSGSGLAILVWMSYEEPLQPSCLGKNHWFYSIRPKKYQNTIGFTVSVWKSIKNPLVLKTGQPKTLENHWFYRPSNQKRWKTIGFTSNRATEQPSNRRAPEADPCIPNTRAGWVMRNPYSQAV